jgi:hypothetical protein
MKMSQTELKISDELELLISEAEVKVYELSGIRMKLLTVLSDIERLERTFQLTKNWLVQQRMQELHKRMEVVLGV